MTVAFTRAPFIGWGSDGARSGASDLRTGVERSRKAPRPTGETGPPDFRHPSKDGARVRSYLVTRSRTRSPRRALRREGASDEKDLSPCLARGASRAPRPAGGGGRGRRT